MDQKKTGQFLRQLRSEKQLTQEQLAKKFNVSNRSVSRWETGSNLPDISLLVEIADFYGVDVREIIDGERKSEMNDEIREVADKMADYSNNEKKNRLTWVQLVGIFGVIVSLFAVVAQMISYEPGVLRFMGLLASVMTLTVMSIITLYVTGILKKFSQKRAVVITVVVIAIASSVLLAYVLFTGIMVVGMFGLAVLSEKVHVETDPGVYNTYIHNENPYSEYHFGASSEFNVMPKKMPDDQEITEFNLTYYNPWDPQYLVYITIDYDDAAYEKEMKRLNNIGVEDEYVNYYSVTGEPEGYDLVAMDASEYYGFVYAMVKEGVRDNEITYVAVYFCNYLLDIDVHKYIPEKYLLPGFDATDNNPYRKKMMND